MTPLRDCRSPASSGLIAPQHAAVIEQPKSDGHSCQLGFDVSPSLRSVYRVDCTPALITDEVVKRKSLEWGVFREFAPLLGSTPERSEGAWQEGCRSCLKVWRQIDRERARER